MTLAATQIRTAAHAASSHSTVAAAPPDRGGVMAPNGKPSFTTDQGAGSITRDGYSLNGTGVTGTAAVVSYAFRATSGTMPGDTTGFSVFSAAQITATEQILSAWADVANVVFVRDGAGTSGTGAYSDNATMLFGNYSSGNAGAAAFTFYPGSTDAASPDDDIWINTSLSYEANPQLYGYGYLTLAHEIGHAIGLGEAEYLDPGYGSPTYSVNAGYYEDTQQYSVMSAWAPSNTGADFGSRYASAPMMDDIAAAQLLYGANMTTRTGDTVYGFNSNSGLTWASASNAASALIVCVWDAGGTDTFDFSGYAQDAYVDLRATHFSNAGGLIGNVSIAQGVTIENAIGGSGNDTFVGNVANNSFTGNGGTDLVDASDDTAGIVLNLSAGTATGAGIGADTLSGIENFSSGSAVDTLNGDNANNRLSAGGGNDALRGYGGNDRLDGGAGNDKMYGGAGNDTYVVDSATDGVSEQTVLGVDDGGIDTVESSVAFALKDFFENLTLTGTANINGVGNALDNVIFGNAGSNKLLGGDGNDTLNGGDAWLGILNDAGGAFHGTLATAMAISPAAFSLRNDLNIENATTVAHATVQGTGDNTLRVYSITVNQAGAIGSFDIDATVGMDSYLRLYDAAGNLLAENDDATVLTLGAGGSVTASDSYLTYTFLAAGTYYVEVADYSHDAVDPGDTYTLHISLANNGAAAAGGADILDGGLGADSMTGGLGNDTFYVDNLGDTAIESANEGVDLVISTVSFVLGANVDNLTLSGAAAINGTGNDLANIITGNAAANLISAGDGNDLIYAGAGNDAVDGGAGNDTLDYASDTVGFSASLTGGFANGGGIGNDGVAAIENLNGGSGADTLAGNAESNLLNGGAGKDVLQGFAGNDVLNGGLGGDTMYGGADNDTYYADDAGDVMTEQTAPGVDAGGIDQVYSSVAWTLGTFFENLTLTGNQHVAGSGNAQENLIAGNSGGNALSGFGGNDTLTGGAGSDKLDGGTGNDIMYGGADNDTYYVDSAGDRVSEQTVTGVDDGGYDTVNSLVSFQLGDFIENLVLIGTAATNASGNDWGNRIVGNDAANRINGLDGWDLIQGKGGNDVIDGGSGQDSMYGGAGNDTYFVDDTGDKISEQTVAGVDDGGIDVVNSTVSFTIGSFIEVLNLTGLASIDGTGNAQVNTISGNNGGNVLKGMDGADVLFGNGGIDTLDGGTGADRMYGGSGNDTYIIDNAGDLVSEQRVAGVDDGGVDTVQSSLGYALGAFIENLTLTGTANINAAGNALNNVLVGNAGGNVLNGGAGNDTLTGGAGGDIFQFLVGSGADIITDFTISQKDQINVHAYGLAVHTVTQVGLDAVIDLGGGNTVTVQNATATDPLFLARIVW